MELELWIDALHVGALPPSDTPRLGAALESELQRLIEAQGLPSGWGVTGVELAIDAIQPPTAAGAEALGAHLARAIYGAMVNGQNTQPTE